MRFWYYESGWGLRAGASRSRQYIQSYNHTYIHTKEAAQLMNAQPLMF